MWARNLILDSPSILQSSRALWPPSRTTYDNNPNAYSSPPYCPCSSLRCSWWVPPITATHSLQLNREISTMLHRMREEIRISDPSDSKSNLFPLGFWKHVLVCCVYRRGNSLNLCASVLPHSPGDLGPHLADWTTIPSYIPTCVDLELVLPECLLWWLIRASVTRGFSVSIPVF